MYLFRKELTPRLVIFKGKPAEKIITYVLIFVAFFTLLAGIFSIYRGKDFTATTGTVIGYDKSKDNYRIIIAFSTNNLRRYEFSPNLTAASPTHQIGDTVGVLFNPQNPEDALVNEPLYIWLPRLYYLGFGLIMSFLVGYLVFKKKSFAKK